MGDIARIMVIKDDVDGALKLLRDEMQVHEDSGDRQAKANTMGEVAKVMTGKGNLDEALKLHRERIEIFEELGDRRSEAVATGDIARIISGKGDLDEALKLHRKRLQVFEKVGDSYSKAVTLWDITNILLTKQSLTEAFETLKEAYRLVDSKTHLHDSCNMGMMLGQLYCRFNDKKKGIKILKQSQKGFKKLGDTERARKITGMIKRY